MPSSSADRGSKAHLTRDGSPVSGRGEARLEEGAGVTVPGTKSGQGPREGSSSTSGAENGGRYPDARVSATIFRLGLVRVDVAGRISQIDEAATALLGEAAAEDLRGSHATHLPGAEAVDLIGRLRGDYGRASAASVDLDLDGVPRRLEMIVVTEAHSGGDLSARLAGAGDPGKGERHLAAFPGQASVPGVLGPAVVLLREVPAASGPRLDEAHIEALMYLSVAESSDAVIGLSAEKKVTFWNRGAQRIFGYAEAEIVGRDVSVLLPAGARYAEETARIADELARGETVRRLETRRVTKYGRPVDVLLTQAPLTESACRAGDSVLIMTDISPQRALESRLKQAERLSTAGQMAAMLAHEVRNPLNSAILNIEMLREEFEQGPVALQMDGEQIATLLKRTDAELHELREAADAYLSLARMPSGSVEEVDLNDLIEQLLAFLEKEIEGAGVRLQIKTDARVPPLPLDPIRIKRSLMNLVRNALEAMDRGGELCITTALRGRHVTATIADTGVGLTDQQVRRIFEPYFTTKRFGSGLGLSYAQKTVREHGGEIRCRSMPGEGTAFTITLPIEPEAR